MGKVALVAGATGLIGGQLLELLLQDNYYERVIAISRKPLALSHAKLQNELMELNDLSARNLKADDVFCCLGTTMRKAKTKEAFLKVDFQAPVDLAKMSKENGASRYFLVSALGASKSSRIFYNETKGKVEEAIGSIGFSSFHIFRPSLLLGPRQEQRSGEDAAKFFYRALRFLIPKAYQAIESIKVARAMFAKAKENATGTFIYESAVLQDF